MKISNFIYFDLKHRLTFIVALLLVFILFGTDFNTHPVLSEELDLPKIPSRPKFNQLSCKLNIVAEVPEQKIDLNYGAKKRLKPAVKVRGFNNGLANYKNSAKYNRLVKHSSGHDEFVEKVFGLSNVQLFANLLSVVDTLNLSLKFFDAGAGKIVVKDKLKNIIVFQILPQSSSFSKVEIFGYGSLIGKHHLSNTTAAILDKLSERIKK